MSKILVIVGATGKQGGSVIKSFLADPKAAQQYKLRGITRDASKQAAKELTALGVEMVSADLEDQASLVKAFEGAWGVFAVTDYWAKLDKGIEVKQGKDLADAAKEAGVQHYVFSTLINTFKSTGGKLTKIDHFDGKAEVADYIRSIGLPASFYLPGLYMTGLPGQAIIKTDSGKYILTIPCEPDAQIPLVDIASDTGKFVKAIFLNRDATLGKDIYGAARYYTPVEIAAEFERVFPVDGKGIEFVTAPGDQYVAKLKSFGMPTHAAEELLENMQLLNKEYGYYAGADVSKTASILTESLVTWAEFLKAEPQYAGLK